MSINLFIYYLCFVDKRTRPMTFLGALHCVICISRDLVRAFISQQAFKVQRAHHAMQARVNHVNSRVHVIIFCFIFRLSI